MVAWPDPALGIIVSASTVAVAPAGTSTISIAVSIAVKGPVFAVCAFPQMSGARASIPSRNSGVATRASTK